MKAVLNCTLQWPQDRDALEENKLLLLLWWKIKNGRNNKVLKAKGKRNVCSRPGCLALFVAVSHNGRDLRLDNEV